MMIYSEDNTTSATTLTPGDKPRQNPADISLLEIHNLSKHFGEQTAVDNVTLTIQRGSITGLIGPNGAGKSTLFETIVGELRSDSGKIVFDGKALHALSADQVYRTGLARTFQIPQPFPEMTVLDNLMLAAPGQLGETFWAPIVRPAAIRLQEEEHLQRAHEILTFTTLDKLGLEAARNLSGGQQKLLELARVLMGKPQMIMLDEPAAGVNPVLTHVLMDRIHALNQQGITFLIIEHNMDLVMRHCDPIIAMANGRVIFTGNAYEALACEELLDSYLGDIDMNTV
ncbi:MAG: branched-chain amino acid transport system ATP-binding protein [Granulosicoccus sp.]|jgi:branched-chain amino acid transport system ATP-binding protein